MKVSILRALRGNAYIVHLEKVFETPRTLYLVTELCTGGELYDQIVKRSGQGHTEAEAATIMRQMLQAIRCCHEDHSICHRDLKPENFLLKNRDDLSQIRMIDFGMSRYFEKGERLMTRLGTLFYTAPEVWSQDYDNSCDLWSAGVIMYVHVACDSAFL